MQNLSRVIMEQAQAWVKEIVRQAQAVRTPQDLVALEDQVHQASRRLACSVYQQVSQIKVQHSPPPKTCPTCGHARRHKGERRRAYLTRMGNIDVTGVYWYCPVCRTGQHAADHWFSQSISPDLHRQVVLLGTALASFQKAEAVCRTILQVPISDETIRTLCLRTGRQVRTAGPRPRPIDDGQTLLGSCDGTMIHTRQDGWRELRAYQYCYGEHRHGGAFLESARTFVPRLRQAAIALKAKQADALFWVSDAAAWIDKGVAVQLPTAIRIVDLWHARQHVYQAAEALFGPGSSTGRAWAERYARLLRTDGASGLLRHLNRIHYRTAAKRKALAGLIGFLERHATHMDYPTYERAGWPISSGPMESFCKQLGGRLKGPGMRWSIRNVTPMAALVSLWANDEWETYWNQVA